MVTQLLLWRIRVVRLRKVGLSDPSILNHYHYITIEILNPLTIKIRFWYTWDRVR